MPDQTEPTLYGPGVPWELGPDVGCKPGYTQQLINDGTEKRWMCIPYDVIVLVTTGKISYEEAFVRSIALKAEQDKALAAEAKAAAAIIATAPAAPLATPTPAAPAAIPIPPSATQASIVAPTGTVASLTPALIGDVQIDGGPGIPHALLPVEHVSIVMRLVHDVEKDVLGAKRVLLSALQRVFGHL